MPRTITSILIAAIILATRCSYVLCAAPTDAVDDVRGRIETMVAQAVRPLMERDVVGGQRCFSPPVSFSAFADSFVEPTPCCHDGAATKRIVLALTV